MRLAIIEPEHRLGSHHCNYVYAVAREAIRRGWKLCLISSEGEASHPVLSRVRQESGTDIKAICCQKVGFPSRPSAMKLLRYQYQQYRVLSYAYEALKSFQADVIYLNSLDTCDKMISLFGSPCADTPLAGMLLAPKFHHSRLGVIGSASRFNRAAELSFKRLLRLKTFRALLTIDELLIPYAQVERYRGVEKIHRAPDFAPVGGDASRASARDTLGITDRHFVVLVYGQISYRKGVDALVSAVIRDPSLHDVCILVAGPQDEAVREYLRCPECEELRRGRRLVELAGVLLGEEEYKAFKASDAVWLGYRQHSGMSSVMFPAGSLRLPIIACHEGLIAWLSRLYCLGEIVDIREPGQIAAALHRLINNLSLRAAYGANGAALAIEHTARGFGTTVCDVLSSCT